MAENCDAPVNVKNDNAQACHTDAPADTAAKPNDRAVTPTAAPSVILAVTTRFFSVDWFEACDRGSPASDAM
jgi:hypothetical protein